MKKLGIFLVFLGLAQQAFGQQNLTYFQQLQLQYGTIFNANELIEGLRQKNRTEIIVPPPQFPPPQSRYPVLLYEPNIKDSFLFPDPEESITIRKTVTHRRHKAGKKKASAAKKNVAPADAPKKVAAPKTEQPKKAVKAKTTETPKKNPKPGKK